ncbi:protein starmaker-like isoform X2 [Chelmon rostratus]|uniref:protein starmaker-like isoform X2 n=1 Tax=Chelmon rostratus TaxID=109905 RepID=UPI001BEC600E|nr:protein starmaker-like isoform X2 [Chelmon rostratus]
MAQRHLLTLFILTSFAVAGESSKYALKGKQVSLKPDITGHPAEILWKHNGNKVVEFDSQEESVFNPFKNRVTLDWQSAELNITDLSFEDSGKYVVEVYINRQLHEIPHELEVIEIVAKPTISCTMNDGGGSNMSATLECSAEPRHPQSLMTFEWSSHGNVHPGTQLIISLGEKHDDEVYSCRVSNPLSHDTATFTAKHCYPNETSAAVIAGVVSAVILLLIIVIAGVFFCRHTHKACFAKGTRDDLKKQSPPGSDEEKAQRDENTRLLDRAPTLPSTQPLRFSDQDDSEDERPRKGHVQSMKKHFEPNNSGQTAPTNLQTGSESPSCPDVNHLVSNDTGDADADQSREAAGEKVPLCATEADPAGAPARESSAAPEYSDDSEDERPRKGDVNNLASNDKGDADADQSREAAGEKVPLCATEADPAGAPARESSTAPEHSVHDMDSEDEKPTKELEKEAEAEETEEAKSLPANGVFPTTQPCSPLTQNSPNMAAKDTAAEPKEDAISDQVNAETGRNLRKFNSSGIGKTNESDNCSRNEQTPSVPEDKGSETLHGQDSGTPQEETHISDDKQQEINKLVSAAENETDSDGQPQNSTPAKLENTTTSTLQESPDTANTDPGQQEKGQTGNNSDDSGEDDGETAEDKNGEEKSGLSEDKDTQKKDEVVALSIIQQNEKEKI